MCDVVDQSIFKVNLSSLNVDVNLNLPQSGKKVSTRSKTVY